jgi:hypothetical protein
MLHLNDEKLKRRFSIRWQWLATLGILIIAIALGITTYNQMMSPVLAQQTTEARETELIATYQSADQTAAAWTAPLIETANAHFAPDLTAWAQNPPADPLQQTPTLLIFEVTRSAYIDQLKTQIAATPDAAEKP